MDVELEAVNWQNNLIRNSLIETCFINSINETCFGTKYH